jgi:hypothetical protein
MVVSPGAKALKFSPADPDCGTYTVPWALALKRRKARGGGDPL